MVQSNPQMSKTFQEQERKNKEAEDAAKQADWEGRRKIFFSPASKHKVANFVKEKRQDGLIVQPEFSLGFEDNLFITDDPAKIKHIRESYSFKNGIVKECDSMEEANRFRMNLRHNIKAERVVKTSVEETQRIA